MPAEQWLDSINKPRVDSIWICFELNHTAKQSLDRHQRLQLHCHRTESNLYYWSPYTICFESPDREFEANQGRENQPHQGAVG